MSVGEASLDECRYYLILAEDLGYGKTAELTSLRSRSIAFSMPTHAPF
jgi:hypothetical protein